MSYNLQGTKYLICINVINYDGRTPNRNGAEADEKKLIQTFKASVKSKIGKMVNHIKVITFACVLNQLFNTDKELSWIRCCT